MPNAALEWQAGSLRWRSREMIEACPLEGLVGKCTSPVAETSQDGVSIRQPNSEYGSASYSPSPRWLVRDLGLA